MYKRPHTKIVLGMRVKTVPHDKIEEYMAELRKANIGRQLVRAGKLREGITCTTIHRSTDGYKITVAVIGMTDEPVQHTQPQIPCKRGTETDAPSVEWHAAFRGHDAPIISPLQVWRMVRRAMPVANDDSGIRIKRVSPFGAARQYVKSRGEFPKMIPMNDRRSQVHPGHTKDRATDTRERLNRAAVREIIRTVADPFDVPNGKMHALIADFIWASNVNYCDLHYWRNTIVDDLGIALELPIRLLPIEEHRLSIAGYLGPPSRGGRGWHAAASWLFRKRYLETDFMGFAPEDESLPPEETALLIREPGRQRKLVAIHMQNDAVAFGDAVQIPDLPDLCIYVQPFKNFLAYVLSIWGSPPMTKEELYERIPSPPSWARPRFSARSARAQPPTVAPTFPKMVSCPMTVAAIV